MNILHNIYIQILHIIYTYYNYQIYINFSIFFMIINQLKILQWNSRSVKNRHELSNYADNYDIIVIIESWLKPTENFNLKGFNTVRYDRVINLNNNNDNTVGGGIVIFIKKFNPL